jgi:membrane fusion protein
MEPGLRTGGRLRLSEDYVGDNSAEQNHSLRKLRDNAAEPGSLSGNVDTGPSDPLPLFRGEPFSTRHDLRLGSPVVTLPRSWSLLAVICFVFVLLGVSTLVFGSYARTESARGILRPAAGEARVIVPRSGVLTRLMVSEGQNVRVGDVLMVVSTAQTGTSGSPADQEVLGSLDADIVSLEGRLAALRPVASMDDAGLRRRLRLLHERKIAFEGLLQDGEQRQRLATESLEAVKPLVEQGYMSREEFRRREQYLLSEREASAEATVQLTDIEGQIAELDTRIEQRPFLALSEQGRLRDQLSSALRHRAELVAEHGYSVRAEIAGRISGVQVAAGQHVSPERPAMTIMPADERLVADIYVPSRAAGFLKADQEVRLRFDAFPFERFGGVHGRIRAIASSVLRPEEIQAAVPVEEPVYRVLVELDESVIRAYGRPTPLQPGMALTADIVLERRNFASWLLEPLQSIWQRD